METPALTDAFSAETFRHEGHRLVDLLADHLARAQARGVPVLPAREPARVLADFPSEFPEEPEGESLCDLVSRVLEASTHLHHPGFVGHQVSTPLPAAALAELAAALLNNGMAVFEMGPAATAMERSVLRWLAARLGYSSRADGVLTSGGSVGNLTALLAARQAKAGFDVWQQGTAAGPPLAILASTECHYSVRRAAQVMGLGAAGVAEVPVDARFRMRPDALPEALASAESRGLRVLAVVASAGSTATGAFDPLSEIADFCAARDLWLHVDGAHGAAAALSPRTRGLVAGIERADSVVLDAHKLLLLPALVTAVLYRDGAHAWQAFAQEASYLFHRGGEADRDALDVGQRTLECTKRMMGLELYATLRLLGSEVVAGHVERCFALGRRLAALVQAAPDFELALEPECNIVCFRHVPARQGGATGAADLDALQDRVRERVLASGAFYLVKTRLRGATWLRCTLLNPLTTEADLEALLDALREAARS